MLLFKLLHDTQQISKLRQFHSVNTTGTITRTDFRFQLPLGMLLHARFTLLLPQLFQHLIRIYRFKFIHFPCIHIHVHIIINRAQFGGWRLLKSKRYYKFYKSIRYYCTYQNKRLLLHGELIYCSSRCIVALAVSNSDLKMKKI